MFQHLITQFEGQVVFPTHFYPHNFLFPGGTPKKIVYGVRPASHTPYPIYD